MRKILQDSYKIVVNFNNRIPVFKIKINLYLVFFLKQLLKLIMISTITWMVLIKFRTKNTYQKAIKSLRKKNEPRID